MFSTHSLEARSSFSEWLAALTTQASRGGSNSSIEYQDTGITLHAWRCAVVSDDTGAAGSISKPAEPIPWG